MRTTYPITIHELCSWGATRHGVAPLAAMLGNRQQAEYFVAGHQCDEENWWPIP